MEPDNLTSGLTERILKEVLATPAMKDLIVLSLKDIKAETASGLIQTLLWGDPGISMSLFGAFSDIVNWQLELLLELGKQLNGLPEPLLKDILSEVGKGIDYKRLKQFQPVYAQLANRLFFGDNATPEEKRAAIVRAVNSLMAGADKLTLELERNRQEIARTLARGIKDLDKAALGRSLRRVGLVAGAAVRGPREKSGGKASKAAATAAATAACGVAGLIALRLVVKRVKG